MRLERVGVLAIAAKFVVVSVLYLVFKNWRSAIVGEDRVLEMTTVLLLVAATALSAVRTRWTWSEPRTAEMIALRAIPFLTLLAVLDELSFGMRIFGFDPPVIEGATLDAVHDLILISALFVKHRASNLVIVLLGLVMLAALFRVTRWFIDAGYLSRFLRLRPASFFLASLAFFLFGTILDLEIVTIPALQLWEELAELAGALLVLLGVVAIPKRAAPLELANLGARTDTPSQGDRISEWPSA